jgi:hypothetical protein
MNNALRLAVVMFAGAASVFVVSAPPASAAPPGCTHTFNTKTTTLDANRNYYYDVTQARAHKVASDSRVCGVISLRSLEASSVCAGFRVRIFPSSGGSYTRPATGWRQVCGGDAADLASGHVAGTRYRLESTRDNMDVRMRD